MVKAYLTEDFQLKEPVIVIEVDSLVLIRKLTKEEIIENLEKIRASIEK